jgi:hypothetical protein
MVSENPLSAALLRMLMPAGRLDTNRNRLFAGCGVVDFFDHQSSDSPKSRLTCMINLPLVVFFYYDSFRGDRLD